MILRDHEGERGQGVASKTGLVCGRPNSISCIDKRYEIILMIEEFWVQVTGRDTLDF